MWKLSFIILRFGMWTGMISGKNFRGIWGELINDGWGIGGDSVCDWLSM